jgi:membrane protease YdiL (CAAX protease family)
MKIMQISTFFSALRVAKNEITRSMKKFKKVKQIQSFNNPKPNFKDFIILVFLSSIANIATIPYILSIYPNYDSKHIPLLLLGTLFTELFISLPLIILGLWLGSQIGLGIPLIKAIISRNRYVLKYFKDIIIISIVLGVIGGILIIFVSLLFQNFTSLSKESFNLKFPNFISALSGSFGAGVAEEIYCRLGIMTIIAWLGCKIARRKKPNAVLIWIANILAAVIFGTMHFPLATDAFGQLTIAVIANVLLLNGIAGIIFGWLYWQYGLLAAMIAHFSTDVVIHAIPSLFR